VVLNKAISFILFCTILALMPSAYADDIAECKIGDHYTDIEKDYNTCNRALLQNNLDSKSHGELLFARAETEYYGNRLDLALNDLDEAIKLIPDYRDAIYRRARVYTSLGRYDDALNELTRLVEKNSNDSEAIFGLGFIYLEASSDPFKALEYFEAAIKIDPNYYLARYQIGNVKLNYLNKPKDAAIEFGKILSAGDKALSKVRKTPRPSKSTLNFKDTVLSAYIKASVGSGNLSIPGMLENINGIIARYPLATEPLIDRASYNLATAHFEDGFKDGKRAMEIAPYDGSSFLITLNCLRQLKRWQEGIDLANTMLASNARGYDAEFILYNKASFQENLGKNDEALESYESAIQINPEITNNITSNLIQHNYYVGKFDDRYDDKIRNGLKACIIDPEC
jgi:tetratricopeptide (TPR) repeat protein